MQIGSDFLNIPFDVMMKVPHFLFSLFVLAHLSLYSIFEKSFKVMKQRG